MWQRLKLLKRLQEVDVTSLDEGLELLERIKTNTGSVEDRGRFVHLMRVTLEVTEAIRSAPEEPAPPGCQRPSPKPPTKRKRQLAKAARRRQRR